jgi:IclR family acetate operon transcriptional repressor
MRKPGARAPKPEQTPRYRVQSVARAAEILRAVGQSEHGTSRKDISREVGLSAQTTYHILHTLSQLGLTSRNERGNYVLGVRVAGLAEGFRRQMGETHHIGKILRAIASKTGESVYALKWVDGEIVSFDVARGRYPIQVAELPLGISEDAHSRSGGKLLLAYAPEEVRKDYLARHPLRRRTPHTVCSKRELYNDFDQIREQGYALENGEYFVGLSCIAVPLDSGASPFAFGISAPTERIEANFKSYLDALKNGATNLSDIQS